jgi:hypothetical protein
MGKVVIKVLTLSLIVISIACNSKEVVVKSPVNGRELVKKNLKEYSFLVGGHLYGNPLGRVPVFPAGTLLANLNRLNQMGAEFFISLGDNYWKADKYHIENFISSFSSQLKMPLFISPGNHDLTKRDLYEGNFGKTYYSFIFGRECYIILDSELSGGRISGPQFSFLQGILKSAANNKRVKTVFIFSHKLIWAGKNQNTQIVRNNLNSLSGYAPVKHFKRRLEPLLMNLAKKKSVYWISGDIGVSWSLSLFYEKDPSSGVIYAAVGIGDTVRDALLKIHITESGNRIKMEPVSLAGRQLKDIYSYNSGYWEKFFRDKKEKEERKKAEAKKQTDKKKRKSR